MIHEKSGELSERNFISLNQRHTTTTKRGCSNIHEFLSTST
jgi:hypothetical protein